MKPQTALYIIYFAISFTSALPLDLQQDTSAVIANQPSQPQLQQLNGARPGKEQKPRPPGAGAPSTTPPTTPPPTGQSAAEGATSASPPPTTIAPGEGAAAPSTVPATEEANAAATGAGPVSAPSSGPATGPAGTAVIATAGQAIGGKVGEVRF